jgi:hypothetical protein
LRSHSLDFQRDADFDFSAPTSFREEIMRRQLAFLALALSILLGSSSASKANSVEIFPFCFADTACNTGASPTPWTDFLGHRRLPFLVLANLWRWTPLNSQGILCAWERP